MKQTVVSFIQIPVSTRAWNVEYGVLTCGHQTLSRLCVEYGKEDPKCAVGQLIECDECDLPAREAQRIINLTEPVFHARYSERWGGQYHLYRRDKSSPTGVMLITSVKACPEVDAVLLIKKISPLSPTEGRYR